MSTRVAAPLALVALGLVDCGGHPPPRACGTEAPPAISSAPNKVGMCATDPPPDAGPATPADADGEATPDAR